MPPALIRLDAITPGKGSLVRNGWKCLSLLLAVTLLAGPPAWAAKAKPKAKAAVTRDADADADAVTYGRRPDAIALANSLADKHGLDPAWVRASWPWPATSPAWRA